jgi:lambda repressor-like predicted transcriptional regulator
MTKVKAAVRHRPYHHGDLYRAILSAALKVLGETESTESLRELARRAGVSHNAPRSTLPNRVSCWQPYQPSPNGLSGRPAHDFFRGLLGVHSRYGCTLALSPYIVTR